MSVLDSGTYVRINPRFRLRGWLDAPYALVDHLRAVALFVPEGLFATLRLCNGAFRSSDAVFIGPRQAQLELLAHKGVLEFSDVPRPLEPEQEYRYHPNHYLRQVQWSLTGHCNYRCRHCYMSAPHAALPQASTEECLRIADQMGTCGVQVVKLTGGECLVRPDFLQIIDRLLENDVQIATILTNGALLNEELLDALEERGVRCGFDISFDGVSGWHDWLRGVPGAGKAAVRAFELCRERGFPTGSQVVLHRNSTPALRDTIRLLGELGASDVVVAAIKPEGEAHGMQDQILSYDEAFDLWCDYLPQFLEDGAPVRSLCLGDVFRVVDGVPRLYKGYDDLTAAPASTPACAALLETMYLAPDGYILPCIPMSQRNELKEGFPMVGETTLSEVLTDSSYYRAIRTSVGDVLEHNRRCRECAYASRCGGGCRAKGVDENDEADTMGYDPESCRYYLGGYHDRALKLLEQLLT